MATHEQAILGPVFEAMENEGWLTISPEENAYGVVAEFVRKATEAGVLIDADRACKECWPEESGTEMGAFQPPK